MYLQIIHATYESSIKNQKMNQSIVITVPEKWKEHMGINVLLFPRFSLPFFISTSSDFITELQENLSVLSITSSVVDGGRI